ncbi:MAG TPA: hypothetical protein VN696_04345 [Pyrinomonadaceae bacterium]|nr:hypothetical protein [Pyrinomonadaceae bacterium]
MTIAHRFIGGIEDEDESESVKRRLNKIFVNLDNPFVRCADSD